MKKHLLFASLLLTGSSFAQSLTQANEPAIGATAGMFLCDSNATAYANVTGSGVTWDYSQVGGYAGQIRTISIVDPTTTANSSDFPGSTKAIVIENLLTTYWTSTSTERTSSGFVFEEPSFGTVKAIFDDNPQTLATYPFALNDEVSDLFEGSLSFTLGVAMNPAANGTSFSKIDGKGTLKLNAATSLTDVIRCVTIDTLFTNVMIAGDIQLVRTQYEYYHLTTGNMPVFTYTTAKIEAVGGGAEPLTEFTVVLNSVEPDEFVSLKEATKTSFSIFPNPANEKLTITGDFSGASARIFDQAGKEVKNMTSVTPGSTIEVSSLQKGMYFLELNANGVSTVQKFTRN